MPSGIPQGPLRCLFSTLIGLIAASKALCWNRAQNRYTGPNVHRAKNVLHRDLWLPDELPRLRKGRGHAHRQGYARWTRVEEADLIFYNTCSIRDKAEQKVFHRLNDFKKLQAQGKKFGVLGCVAQQEGEKIFERAPYVSLVAGSASYRNLPEMLVQIEAGERRVTGLDDRETDQTFETEFTARTNPHRGYITIIEGCDKFCAYCVVPYTRGKERSRTSESVLEEARRMADAGYTEIQLLGQNVNSYRDPAGKKSFAELLTAVAAVPAFAACASPLHIPATSPGTSLTPSSARPDALRSRASAGAERVYSRAQSHASRVHARGVPGAYCLDEGGARDRSA